MKRPQSSATLLRIAVIDASPAVIPFPTAKRGPRRENPRGRDPKHLTVKSPDAALGQLRARLYHMIVENERGRSHGNRAS